MRPIVWRDQAACRDADPELFAAPDRHDRGPLPRLTAAAMQFCGACTVVDRCAQVADDDRLWGLWGGAYRRWSRGEYRRTPLANGVVLMPLQPRRTGVNVGWVAS